MSRLDKTTVAMYQALIVSIAVLAPCILYLVGYRILSFFIFVGVIFDYLISKRILQIRKADRIIHTWFFSNILISYMYAGYINNIFFIDAELVNFDDFQKNIVWAMAIYFLSVLFLQAYAYKNPDRFPEK